MHTGSDRTELQTHTNAHLSPGTEQLRITWKEEGGVDDLIRELALSFSRPTLNTHTHAHSHTPSIDPGQDNHPFKSSFG